MLCWRGNQPVADTTPAFTLDDVARFDHPAALRYITTRTGHPSIHVIAHCLGAQTLLMALLARHTDRVRSLLCMHVAAHWESPPLLALKVRTGVPNLLDALGVGSFPVGSLADDSAVLRWLDAALLAYPISDDERCRNPTCRRAALLFGEIVRHRNINNITHERMARQFGHAPVRPFIQMAAIARRGELVDIHGRSYLGDLDPLRLPITFLHGENNGVVGPATTGRTWELLRDRHGDALYRRVVLPGYGHNDALVGDHAARDVYPLLLDHLAWAASHRPP